MDPEETALAFDVRELHMIGERHEDGEVEQTDDGVEDEERPVRVGALQPERHEEAPRPTAASEPSAPAKFATVS